MGAHDKGGNEALGTADKYNHGHNRQTEVMTLLSNY